METTEWGGKTAFGRDCVFSAGVMFRENPADDVFCEMSEAAAALTGYSGEELTLPEVRQDLIFADDRASFLEARRKVLAGEPASIELRLVTKRGEKRWLKLFAEPRLGEDGRPFGMVMTGFDVTAYKVDQEAWRSAVEFASDRAAYRASSLVASEARMERLAGNLADFLDDGVSQVLVSSQDFEGDLAGIDVERHMAAVGRLRSGAVMLQRLLGVSRALLNRERIDLHRFASTSPRPFKVEVEKELGITADRQILAYIFEALDACAAEGRHPSLAKAMTHEESCVCLLGVPAFDHASSRGCDRHAMTIIQQGVERHGGKSSVDHSLGLEPCLMFDFGPDSVW